MSAPRFGRFELLERIGSGGVGEVLLVSDGAGRYALKRLLPHLEELAARDAFDREAALLTRLRHPNIVEVLEHGRVGDVRYLLMEHVDGPSLHRLLRAGGRLPPAGAAFVARELCAALGCVHGFCDGDGRRLGLVHRDVTPSNVLVSRRGEVKLCDFGIAKHASTTGTRTRPGFIKGKRGYRSPEQEAGATLDERSDVYAVGVILFESLTGRRPEGPRDRPSQHADHVPPALDEVCARALAVERDERFASAAELAAALAPLVDERDGARAVAAAVARWCPSRAAVGREATRTLAGLAARRRWLLATLALAAVAAALALTRRHAATSVAPVAPSQARPATAPPQSSAVEAAPPPPRHKIPPARERTRTPPNHAPQTPSSSQPADYMPDPFTR